ncbi:heparan-alpha-glucosaminide N-acetyltransferase domain-containing protein [Gemmata sp. JC717]|uniref:heparan-alpha-glucosaminide N-acetyltransferase domain-containing protein n=1 Tax=Gemmata algarum TaxID=2975278 RepID=UPI0021BAE01F|nr:heparan-alpha-glucosaminide N-acetyltransferase domain-containing protein [Gemmata algarum]MDY3553843.1 heparan-alpha-glucosaminide N-acetyltransferase domain-containing protein [Gemmata algarum]
MSEPRSAPPRLASLDQFRGYTVLGMLLVNFVGSFAVIKADVPVLAHHHTYCSYADTIMPQFLFAVGFAFRLTFARRRDAVGPRAAYGHAARRNLALLLVAFAVYSVGSRWEKWDDLAQRDAVLLRWAKQDLFQTLGHIAVTSLWVLPVIAARPRVRFGFAVLSGALHVGLSYWFNYRWANTPPNGVDGGPLGFLTWAVPLLAGTLACDLYQAVASRGRLCGLLLLTGLAVGALAYGLSCLHLAPSDLDEWRFHVTASAAAPPLVYVDVKPPTNDLFTMSQRSGSLTYTLFGAGVSLVVLALFVLACDVGGLRWGVFDTFGSNALAVYIAHGLVFDAAKPFVPRDAPLWYVAAACGLALGLCYLFVRHLEKHRLFLKL